MVFVVTQSLYLIYFFETERRFAAPFLNKVRKAKNIKDF